VQHEAPKRPIAYPPRRLCGLTCHELVRERYSSIVRSVLGSLPTVSTTVLWVVPTLRLLLLSPRRSPSGTRRRLKTTVRVILSSPAVSFLFFAFRKETVWTVSNLLPPRIRPALPATRFARSDVPPSLRVFGLVQGRAPRLLLVSEDSRERAAHVQFSPGALVAVLVSEDSRASEVDARF